VSCGNSFAGLRQGIALSLTPNLQHYKSYYSK
jgi:hypothetical protein